jgi:7-carboxy-7-deazaguanine synthase
MSEFATDNSFQQLEKGEILPVMEEFYSLQGEGFHTGKAAYFIRIGGCDVGCYWCDVKESWNPDIHPLIAVETIVERALKYPARSVVVTGGEPLNHNMDLLCSLLKKNKFQIFLETSGSQAFSGDWDWVCLSPKINFPPLPEIYNKAHELKVIIRDSKDFEWAEKNASLVGTNCLLYLQPEWSRRKEVIPLIVEYIAKNPKWLVSLQSHKYMNIP